MRVDRILAEERPVFSFEFFPPKTDEARRTLEGTLEVLKDDRPDDVSVTYGAGGTTGEPQAFAVREIASHFAPGPPP